MSPSTDQLTEMVCVVVNVAALEEIRERGRERRLHWQTQESSSSRERAWSVSACHGGYTYGGCIKRNAAAIPSPRVPAGEVRYTAQGIGIERRGNDRQPEKNRNRNRNERNRMIVVTRLTPFFLYLPMTAPRPIQVSTRE